MEKCQLYYCRYFSSKFKVQQPKANGLLFHKYQLIGVVAFFFCDIDNFL